MNTESRPHLATTVLHMTQFAILGASTRDGRGRIVELAEEKSLELDHDACQKARSDLTNPRTRLSAEISWLPGVSPRKASQLVDRLLQDPMALRNESGLPTLAHVNLLAAGLELVDGEHDPDDLAEFIQEIADLADILSPDDVLRDINEDRIISGFPAITTVDQIGIELSERKRYYRNAIKDALDRLPTTMLIEVMTDVVNGATSGGMKHASGIIDDLVDSYEVETQGILHKEEESILKLIEDARNDAAARQKQRGTLTGTSGSVSDNINNSIEVALNFYVEGIEAIARNWDRIAQPIQLSTKARGIGHESSKRLALAIRNFAIELFNKHNMLSHSQRLTNLLQELFSEVPNVLERVDQDADALTNITQQRAAAETIEPIRILQENVLKKTLRNPSNAFQEGQHLLDEGSRLLSTLPIKANSPAYKDARDFLAMGLMQCAVSYGNATSKWAPCISLLEKALELSSDAKLRQNVNKNLITVKENLASLGDLEPIQGAPSLSTINGIGLTLYGSTDHRPDGSYMATYYFVFLAIPVFPLARYRVIPTGNGYRFLGKGGLRMFDKWHIAISLGLIALMFING